MRGRGFLVIAVLGACNQVYDLEETRPLPDPDLDGDLIQDDVDECIAAAADGLLDLDDDLIPASEDPCPTGDQSGPDGLGECDPFPQHTGDRHLCSMYFRDVDLNARLWRPREGEISFGFASGLLVGVDVGAGTSVVATEHIVPRTGTITIGANWGAPAFAMEYGIRVWISANATVPTEDTDVSCNFAFTDAAVIAIVGGATQVVPMMGEQPTKGEGEQEHALRVQFQPGKTGINVMCTVGYRSAITGMETYATTVGHFDGPLGEQGFAVLGGAVYIGAVYVEHTDDQPPLL